MNQRAKNILGYGAEGLAILVLLFLFYAYQTNGLLAADEQSAPSLSAQTLGGEAFDLRESESSAALVYFFAPWCNVCAASSGNIESLRKLKDQSDLDILLVALDWASPEQVQEYVDRHELTVPVVLGDSKIMQDWNIYAFPTYYILDSQKRVAHRDLGYSTLAGLWLRCAWVD